MNNINNIKNESILNFKSKIIDFCFKYNLIKTNGFVIKLDSENNLIKNTNGISYFRNFIKKGNQIISTKLSYINTLEETFIQFFFIIIKKKKIFIIN